MQYQGNVMNGFLIIELCYDNGFSCPFSTATWTVLQERAVDLIRNAFSKTNASQGAIDTSGMNGQLASAGGQVQKRNSTRDLQKRHQTEFLFNRQEKSVMSRLKLGDYN